MFLCSDGHEEICHEGRDCPLCEAQEEIGGLEEDVHTLRYIIDELEDRIALMETPE